MKFKKPKSEKPNKITKAIPLDVDVIEKCHVYAEQHGLSLSQVVRLAVGDFFINLENKSKT